MPPPGDSGKQAAADRGMQPAEVSAIEISRALLRDATEELSSCWDPFVAMDLSVAMLEAQKAGLDCRRRLKNDPVSSREF